jgi:hypothetical protein
VTSQRLHAIAYFTECAAVVFALASTTWAVLILFTLVRQWPAAWLALIVTAFLGVVAAVVCEAAHSALRAMGKE